MRKGEFGLIESIKEMFADITSGDIEGIGDDCAVIPQDGDKALVVTTDMLVEDIHFLRNAAPSVSLGRKALAVNLSDVAAMGASPLCSFLSIALPPECRGEWIDGFMQGYKELSLQYGVPLVGGDTSSSKGKITINVVAIGSAPLSNIKRRMAARAGDLVAVTGKLGESAAGLADVLAGRYNTSSAYIHHNPTPQVHQGEWLGMRNEVHAMMDLSDGLASDLPHILHASGVAARIETSTIPTTVTLREAVAGGEDYQLLLTVDPIYADALKDDFMERFSTPLYYIGEITPLRDNGMEIEWTDNGVELPDIDWHGFTHF